MPNAAHELAGLLDAWKLVPDGASVASLRGKDGSLRDAQVRAASLYQRVENDLAVLEAQGENVEHYRLFLPDCWEAVFEPKFDWNVTQGSKPVIDVKHIAALRGLARYLDKSGFKPAAFTEGAVTSSQEALAEVLDLLNPEDVNLDEFARDYVFELITQVRTVLSADEHEASISLLRRINELRGALDDIADRIERESPSSETPGLLRRAAARVMPTVIRGSVAVGFFLDSAADIHELTTGHSVPAVRR